MYKSQSNTSSTTQHAKPKWKRLHKLMRQEILSGRWPTGDPIKGQNQLAVEHEASVNTVREAIAALVHEGLLVRERGKKTIVANINALRKRHSVGVFVGVNPLMPEVTGASIIEILGGLWPLMEKNQLASRMYRLKTLDRPNRAASEHVEEIVQDIDGAIIISHGVDIVMDACRTHDVPFVVADHQTPLSSHIPHVTYSRRMSAHVASEHLLQLGHRRIAYIGSTSQCMTEINRMQGFMEVVGKNHLALPAGYLALCEKTFSEIRAATRKLLACKQRPTAICCSTDRIASIALTVLLEEGLRPPHDMSLVSFTCKQDFDEDEVPISGVSQPFEEVGRKTALLLADILQGKPLPPMPVDIPLQFVPRQSCGKPNTTALHSDSTRDFPGKFAKSSG